PSDWSNVDIATTFFPSFAGVGAAILTTQMEDMRHMVNKVRVAAHLPQTVFGDTPLVQDVTNIKGTHVIALRQALTEALLQIGITPPPYTDPNELQLSSGNVLVKAVHLTELVLVME
ncbi:MAG: hypothetical protein ACXV7D_16870, partial [Thermoanaerobaculia bacterium]